ncbi:hypothetical protein Bpla01_43590 [Burkholderia plantarii]|nr:hypothetical protein Bpla01_43590 [Burkholderia plantarii]
MDGERVGAGGERRAEAEGQRGEQQGAMRNQFHGVVGESVALKEGGGRRSSSAPLHNARGTRSIPSRRRIFRARGPWGKAFGRGGRKDRKAGGTCSRFAGHAWCGGLRGDAGGP